MKGNVGMIDRIVRFILGITFLILFFIVNSSMKYIAILLGIVLLFTAVTKFCPLYTLFGIHTHEKSEK